ncbi:uncharacterized protein LOC119989856 [Tripterygium wilfordii]|uniref:uncharacterized protein LOC119989856 n=1 Tax=Tripterygium wilfordii TaxID=458696 RepID=UPI0018F8270A|nr:uncharacterized protein LOC119989856 [Tripterygium wilfordii]
MATNNPIFVAWEEHIISHERGNRVVHFYLKDVQGKLVLAVVGTERSIRHMFYVVSDDLVQAFGSQRFINASTKWRARRDVVDWLSSLVSRHQPPLNMQMDDSIGELRSLEELTTEFGAYQNSMPDQMVLRKLKVQNSEIEWSGVAWICAKQLKHYPAFQRNGTTINVHSFVYIMAEEQGHYVGYLEDMYEDKKGHKKVKVRWFHHNQEVKGIISQLNPHPREVLITPHVQVISAECVDGLATVLTPSHYEKCVVPDTSPCGVHMCFRQLKNNKVKTFSLAKLRGYSNQAILSSVDASVASKPIVKEHNSNEELMEELAHDNPVRMSAKRIKSCNRQVKLRSGCINNSLSGNQIMKGEPAYPKLTLKISRKTMGTRLVIPKSQCLSSFKVGEKIELLCQDSGIRGCWFRCNVLQVSMKRLKVQYDDVKDAGTSGSLEEWVPASREAAPDKLGMRCPGRLRIRPQSPKDSSNCVFEIGAAVDAWWNDGWWEGVVTRTDIYKNDNLQIYLPGENKFLPIQRKHLRTSRDWVGDRWVDIKAKPDIISHLSSNNSNSTKLPMLSAKTKASGYGGAASGECGLIRTSKLEAVEDDKLELLGSTASGGCKVIRTFKLEAVEEDKLELLGSTASGECEVIRTSELEAVEEDKLELHGFAASVGCEVIRTSKHEAIEEDKPELLGSPASNDLENVKEVNMQELAHDNLKSMVGADACPDNKDDENDGYQGRKEKEDENASNNAEQVLVSALELGNLKN